MVKLVQGLIALVGRLLLVAIFLLSVIGQYIPKYADTVEMMRAKGVPYPNVLLPGAIVFLLVGSVSVLFGFHARLGALLLLIFLALASYYFHGFWNLTDETAKQGEMIQFFKNLSMMGAMIFLIGNGAGPGSVDAAKKPT